MCVSMNSDSRLLENATATFSHHVEGLSPYTQYMFRVGVSHTYGRAVGPWAAMLTAEDSEYAHSYTQVHTCNVTHLYLFIKNIDK